MARDIVHSLRLDFYLSLAILVLPWLVACDTPHDRPPLQPGISEQVFDTDFSARAPTAVRDGMLNRPGGLGLRPEIFGGKSADTTDAAPLAVPSGVQAASGDEFTLNFEGTDIATVARAILGEILKQNFTVDQNLQGAVSLYTARPVRREEILPLLENALRFANAILVRSDGGYHIIPSEAAAGVARLEPSERFQPGYGLMVFPAKYITAPTLVRLLENFATRHGMVRAHPGGTLILIQGTAHERAAALDIARSFDVDWMKNQAVGIFPVTHAKPETVIAELNRIMDNSQGGAGEGMLRMQPISRMGAILAISPNRRVLEKVMSWVARLDRADYLESGLRVYPLHFGDARKIAAMLNDVFGIRAGAAAGAAGLRDADQLQPGDELTSATSAPAGRAGTNPGGTPGAGALPGRGTSGSIGIQSGAGLSGDPSKPRAGAGTETRNDGTRPPGDDGSGFARTAGAAAGGASLFPDVRITPDTVNNNLLVFAGPEEQRLIADAIQELDRQPAQVAINATIAEVTLNDQLQYGVTFFLKAKDIAGNFDRASLGFLGEGGLPLTRSVPGLNLLLGMESGPKAILDALRTYTDVKVLSSPSLVVLDNQPAVLQVGDQVPVLSRTATLLESANAPIVNNIEFRATGVILRVLPRVTAAGMVMLNIEQEVSNVVNSKQQARAQSTTPAQAAQMDLTPTISQRNIKSSVISASGQTILLAGLISEQQQAGREGVPGLSDIPVLGDLFSHRDITGKRTELIIFIRPQIIRNGRDAQAVAEEFRAKLGLMQPPAPAKKP